MPTQSYDCNPQNEFQESCLSTTNLCMKAGIYAVMVYLDEVLQNQKPDEYGKRLLMDADEFVRFLNQTEIASYLNQSGLAEEYHAVQMDPENNLFFWRELIQQDLIRDAVKFYKLFMPTVVCDPSLYIKIRQDVMSGKAFQTAALIHEILKMAGPLLGRPEVLRQDWRQLAKCPRDVFSFLEIDEGCVSQYWDGIQFLYINLDRMPTQKNLASAISIYSKVFSSKYQAMTQLFKEYWDAHRNSFSYASSHPEIFKGKNIKDFTVDQRLHYEAYQISRLAPYYVIQKVLYEELERDDSDYECGSLLNSILELKDRGVQDMHMLIINPSVALLKNFDAQVNSSWEFDRKQRTSFVVLDECERQVYTQEFPSYAFYDLHSFSNATAKCDCAILIARDCRTRAKDKEHSEDSQMPALRELYPLLKACANGAEILLFLPQTCFSVKIERDYLLESLKQQCIKIESIMEVPEKLVQSGTKKKMLISAVKEDHVSDDKSTVPLLMTHTEMDSDNAFVFLDKAEYAVPRTKLLHSYTLEELKKDLQKEDKLKEQRRIKKQKVFRFSAELVFEYGILPNRNGHAWGGYAVYKEDITLREKPGGKRKILCRIDGNLTGETQEEVLQKMERVPLNERFYEVAAQQINDQIQKNNQIPSLKTAWYLCRKILNSSLIYNDGEFAELFCTSNEEARHLSDLIITAEALSEQEEKILNSVLGDPQVNHMKWSRFNLFLNTAQELGYIPHNPIRNSEFMKKCREQSRMAQLKYAMRKGYFDSKEQQRMYAFLTEEVDRKYASRPGPRCVLESRYLTGALRWMTPLSLREILALTWSRLKRIPIGEDRYQLEIMYFMNDQNRSEPYQKIESRYKYRKVAIPRCLSELLIQRKKYLMEEFGFTEETLADKPIVSRQEPGIRKSDKQGRYSKQMSAMTIPGGRSAIQELLKSAQIEENILALMPGEERIEFDSNAVSSDLFYSNYRHMMAMGNKEFFSDAEICAQLGVKPRDVYSSNYRDPENDYIQADIAEKLDACFDQYLLVQNDPDLDVRNSISEDISRYTTGIVSGKRKMLIYTGLWEGTSGVLRMRFCSDRGMSLRVKLDGKLIADDGLKSEV